MYMRRWGARMRDWGYEMCGGTGAMVCFDDDGKVAVICIRWE